MNKRIDFNNNGGLPVTQDTFRFMQESYRDAFSALTGIIGNKTIVSGMEVNGGNVNNGWISYNGELVPFAGGPLGDGNYVVIVESGENATFENNAVFTVYFTRIARLSSSGAFLFSELKKPEPIRDVWQRGDVKLVHCDANHLGANFTASGLGVNERTGWQICNGQNGTVNMGGRFPVGFDANNPKYSTLLGMLGEETVTLTEAQMPRHGHPINTTEGKASPNQAADPIRGETQGSVNTRGSKGPGRTIGETGNNEAHNNIPPALITLYLMKL